MPASTPTLSVALKLSGFRPEQMADRLIKTNQTDGLTSAAMSASRKIQTGDVCPGGRPHRVFSCRSPDKQRDWPVFLIILLLCNLRARQG
jgi:hypothetical protein